MNILKRIQILVLIFLVNPFFSYAMEEKHPPQEQSDLDDTALCEMMDEFEADLLDQDCVPASLDEGDDLDNLQEQGCVFSSQSSQPLSTILDCEKGVHDVAKCYFSSKDNIVAYLIDLIKAAKKNIYVAMYQLSVLDVSKALIRAQARGVKVLFVCDKCAENNPAIQLLLKRNVNVFAWRNDGPKALMHHKFALFDDEVVWTGSFNWTYNAKNNCENVTVIKNQSLYAKYINEFNELLKETFLLQYSQNLYTD